MNPDAPLIGFDIGGTHVRAALARGTNVVASRHETWPSGLSPEDDVKFVGDLAMALIEEAHLPESAKAAGVSLAALVNDQGIVMDWPNRPSWRGLSFRVLLEQRIGLPVVIEDDANAAAVAEWTLGAGRGYRHGLVAMIGTGIGAGLILEGRLFRGSNGWAGELGHVTVEPDGEPCPCGKRGCLQLIAGGRALDNFAIRRGLRGAFDLAAAAGRGETWACDALEASGRWIGLALGSVINLLDLEVIIIGGGLSALSSLWWTTIEKTLRSQVLNSANRSIALHKAILPDTAGLLGAITLASQMAGGLIVAGAARGRVGHE